MLLSDDGDLLFGDGGDPFWRANDMLLLGERDLRGTGDLFLLTEGNLLLGGERDLLPAGEDLFPVVGNLLLGEKGPLLGGVGDRPLGEVLHVGGLEHLLLLGKGGRF